MYVFFFMNHETGQTSFGRLCPGFVCQSLPFSKNKESTAGLQVYFLCEIVLA